MPSQQEMKVKVETNLSVVKKKKIFTRNQATTKYSLKSFFLLSMLNFVTAKEPNF